MTSRKGTKHTHNRRSEGHRLAKKERDDHFAAHLPSILQYHQLMLSDGVRNRALARAIKLAVKPGTHFLDIGAGTGVWAILAAKLGAERVVAVEIEEALIPFIYKHAQENGVADRIEIIHGKSDDVKIRGRFDVIVSELFGNDAFGEAVVRSFVDIRTRFLKPGGILIPQALAMFAAPAVVRSSVHDVPASLDLKFDFFRSVKLNYGQSIAFSEHSSVEFVADPIRLMQMDFSHLTPEDLPKEVIGSWKLRSLSKPNAIVTFCRSQFTDEIEMEGFDSQSWGTSFYTFAPLPKGPGVLNFRQSLDPEQMNWTVGMEGGPVQNFAPVFAFTRVRMSQKLTPHKRFRSKDKPKR